MQGARRPASEAYSLYAATKQDDLPAPRASRQAGRNDAEGRHAVPG